MSSSKVHPIIVHAGSVGVDHYNGSVEENETLIFALSNYGFLLKAVDQHVHRVSFAAFADQVEATFDTSTPQTKEVVLTLRSLHERNC